jgi:hypothetical protein
MDCFLGADSNQQRQSRLARSLAQRGGPTRRQQPDHRLQLQNPAPDLLQRGDRGRQEAAPQPGQRPATQDRHRQVDQDDGAGEAGLPGQVTGMCGATSASDPHADGQESGVMTKNRLKVMEKANNR